MEIKLLPIYITLLASAFCWLTLCYWHLRLMIGLKKDMEFKFWSPVPSELFESAKNNNPNLKKYQQYRNKWAFASAASIVVLLAVIFSLGFIYE